jgi:hypothetical protein
VEGEGDGRKLASANTSEPPGRHFLLVVVVVVDYEY